MYISELINELVRIRDERGEVYVTKWEYSVDYTDVLPRMTTGSINTRGADYICNGGQWTRVEKS